MDYRALADALISALNNSTQASITQLDMTRRNTFEDINNRGAKRGTLYSTAGANQQSRFDATKYLPAKAQVQANQQQQTIKIKSDLIETQQKIDAMNKAASQLNGIDDNYFNSLLV
jgi:MFS superfamily sulfate permease-like transporter